MPSFLFLLVFSSQVNQVFHGLGPPAQLVMVPLRLRYSFTTSLVLSLIRIFVVPPKAVGS